MVDAVINALSGLSAEWLVLIISMLPIAELRVGIPLGIAMGLSAWEAFAYAIIGNGLIAVPVLLLLPKVFELLRRIRPIAPFIDKIIKRAQNKADNLNKKSFVGLMLFVGIPLPGTGVWTGCLVAYLLGMRIRYALVAVICGMLIAAVLITVSSFGVFSLIQMGGLEYLAGLLLLVIVAIFIWRRYKKKDH